ncbi:hypothetical protein KC345_g7999 [Hortaea werneckii]|nr:hypothetical protein KC345_g7999 [Hortaea werneckii]
MTHSYMSNHPQEYDWARKAKQFRPHNLEISREGLIKIAVTAQRFVGAGFPGGRPSLDDLTVYYHHQSEQGVTDPQILKEWQQRAAHLETNILTVEWVGSLTQLPVAMTRWPRKAHAHSTRDTQP